MTMFAILYVATNFHLIQERMNLTPEEIEIFDQHQLTVSLDDYYHGMSFGDDRPGIWIENFETKQGVVYDSPTVMSETEAYMQYRYDEDKIKTEFVEFTRRPRRRR